MDWKLKKSEVLNISGFKIEDMLFFDSVVFKCNCSGQICLFLNFCF